MSDAAGLLLDRLRAEGREVRIAPDDRSGLVVTGPKPPELREEIIGHKAALLALLEAEALHEEIARAGHPFAGGQGVALIRYSAWRVPRWVSQSGWAIFADG